TSAAISERIYGNGPLAAKPYESVHNYYQRASQGKVDLQGNVLGWYHFPNNRDTYEPAKAPSSLSPSQQEYVQALLDKAAIFKMASEAMTALDSTHDFAQYDNDGDGDIDLVT